MKGVHSIAHWITVEGLWVQIPTEVENIATHRTGNGKKWNARSFWKHTFDFFTICIDIYNIRISIEVSVSGFQEGEWRSYALPSNSNPDYDYICGYWKYLLVDEIQIDHFRHSLSVLPDSNKVQKLFRTNLAPPKLQSFSIFNFRFRRQMRNHARLMYISIINNYILIMYCDITDSLNSWLWPVQMFDTVKSSTNMYGRQQTYLVIDNSGLKKQWTRILLHMFTYRFFLMNRCRFLFLVVIVNVYYIYVAKRIVWHFSNRR